LNSIIEIRYVLKYWIILFSFLGCGNVMGMLISDSFKTVSQYIYLYLFLIPQIIINGVIVKYEKLNPNNPPQKNTHYGELMVAKWGYEALSWNNHENITTRNLFVNKPNEHSRI